MPPLTIIHTEASDAWGGQDIRVYSEALWLRDQGHRVHLFTPAHGELFRRARAVGLDCEAIPFAKRTKVVDYLRLARRFRVIRPDVVCTHSSVDSWVGLLAAKTCNVPATIRYRHVSTPVRNNFMNRWQYQSLCDHVVTTADAIQVELRRTLGLPSNKVSSIPTGIVAPNLPSREQAKAELRSRFNLPGKALLIGQISVMRSWKGQNVLYQAFEHVLAPRYPQSYLFFVGGGPILDDYRKRIQRDRLTERILLAGHQEDVWPFFRGLDVVVLSSTKNEGIPQAGLQAMFAECPFVATNVGGIPEIVHHEQTGLLVPPDNSSALAAAIDRIIRQPGLADRLVCNALKQVRSKHTQECMGQRLVTLFMQLLAATGK